MAKDPICGMHVEPSSAAGRYEYNGQTYYFCSQHCLAKFREDPEKFLKSQSDAHHEHVQGTRKAHGHAAHAHEHEHVAQQTPKDETAREIYICPMDPEV